MGNAEARHLAEVKQPFQRHTIGDLAAGTSLHAPVVDGARIVVHQHLQIGQRCGVHLPHL